MFEFLLSLGLINVNLVKSEKMLFIAPIYLNNFSFLFNGNKYSQFMNKLPVW